MTSSELSDFTLDKTKRVNKLPCAEYYKGSVAAPLVLYQEYDDACVLVV